MNLEKGKLYYNPRNLLETYFFNGNNLESVSGAPLDPSSVQSRLVEITDPLGYLSRIEAKYSKIRSFVVSKLLPDLV